MYFSAKDFRLTLWTVALSVVCLFGIGVSLCPAQMPTAIAPTTGGGNLGTVVTPAGNLYQITGGTRPGGGPNLFHSFGQFSVALPDTAQFLNTTSQLATSNILARVTGGIPSNIFGAIDTLTYPNANLFLMNPAGVIFGPNAMLNVGGSVHISTADYLNLADGARFSAVPGPSDTLISAAPPAAFGFLGPTSGKITVDHSTLQVPEGKTLALVGGDISIVGGTLVARGAPIELTARESIAISGVGQDRPNHGLFNSTGSTGTPGDITLSAPTIRLENGATIKSTAADIGSAGAITLQGFEGRPAANVLLDNATVSTTISGGMESSTPGTISITADKVTLTNGTYITADSQGAAPAGNITFNVDTLTMTGGPKRLQIVPDDLITDPTFSRTGVLMESTSRSPEVEAGKAGQITIQGIAGQGSAARSVSLEDSTINTRVFGGTAATTPAAITITADSLALSDQSTIYATTNGAAPGGNIELNVNTMRSNVKPDGTLIEGGAVFIGGPSESSEATGGAAGAVTISGQGPESTDPAALIALNNTEIDTFVVGGSATAPAPITITADTVALSNQTLLVTTSSGDAPAGNIALNVNTLRSNVNPDGTPIQGVDGVFFQTPSNSADSTAGAAGSVIISGPGPESTDAAKLVALDKTQISTAMIGGTETTPAAAITITADTVALTHDIGSAGFESDIGQTVIFANSSGQAPAGNIALNVNTLRANVNPDGTPAARGYAYIASASSSSDSSAGSAGTVTISGPRPESTDAATLVALNNAAINTSVAGGTASTTPASVTITADTLSFSGKTLTPSFEPKTTTGIVASSDGSAPAGNITLNVGSLSTQNTILSSSSTGTAATAGNAGSVTIQGVAGARHSPAGQGFNGGATAATTVAMDKTIVSTTIGGGNETSTPAAITFTANTVALTNGAHITADSEGTAPAGEVAFNVDTLITLKGEEANRISAHPEDPDATSNLTSVLVESNSQSPDPGAGQAGRITIQGLSGPGSAAKNVSLADTVLATKVFGGTAATVPATITLMADSVELSNRVVMEAVSAGPSPAGNIELNVNTLRADVNPDGTPIKEVGGVFFNTASQSLDSTAGRAGTVTISGAGRAYRCRHAGRSRQNANHHLDGGRDIDHAPVGNHDCSEDLGSER
ncbi:MAG: filamentous hemagglutinin N-terminal domain-containing protein [Nitrospiraceae bacterium]|nr:filamentous hemagglutinin N-terminal domain-containing protein [Nitrospiraceae bacterium]